MPSTKLTYSRVHTLPVYENVEALQILPSFHYYYNDADGAISKNELILASAGSAGVVKIFKIVRKHGRRGSNALERYPSITEAKRG